MTTKIPKGRYSAELANLTNAQLLAALSSGKQVAIPIRSARYPGSRILSNEDIAEELEARAAGSLPAITLDRIRGLMRQWKGIVGYRPPADQVLQQIEWILEEKQ